MRKTLLAGCILTASTLNALACSIDNQIHALALNMYHEARGEGNDAMQLVGEVTLNRVKNPHFPNTVCGVVYQARRNEKGEIVKNKCQFSWYCDGRSDAPKNNKLWSLSKSIATALLTDSIELLGTEATHYHATRVKPHWAKHYENLGVYGKHVFYVMGDKL